MDWSPLWLSLRVAGWATVLSITLGLLIAYPLARCRVPGRYFLSAAVNLPLVLPPTVLGYALLVALGRRSPLGQIYEHLVGQPLVFTWQGAVAASCIASLPLFVGYARVSLASIDSDLIAAARLDGAGAGAIWTHILIPLARPGLAAGACLAFARALGDFGATLMVAGDTPRITQTMPLAIYDAVLSGDGAIVRAFVFISIVVCLTICYAATRLAPPTT